MCRRPKAIRTATCDNSSLMSPTYILTLSCPDRPGIVHAVSGFLFERGGNILEAAQFSDDKRDDTDADATGLFFMRVSFACNQLSFEELKEQVGVLGVLFDMRWGLHQATQPMRTVLMVSKEGHCLNDLLFRWKSGLLPLDIRAIVSNHRDFYQLAASYNVPFHHIPVTAATKDKAEKKQYDVIEGEGAELVVLARYMQILSNDLCNKLAGRAINIHHSFLPSFKGAKPYYQAHARGVKLIGATAHYVTADLDEGPIIEQDVARADHSKTVEALTAMGRDTESQVLARAVLWHSEHRVLLNGHKTVIFK
jgi:formyltetrahydrofolate deformylase